MTWEEAKDEYFRGDVSLRCLSRQLGVSERTIFRRSKAEHWFEKREQLIQKANQTLEEAAISRAKELGIEMAEQTAEHFKARVSKTVGMLAHRLDALAAAEDASPAQLRGIASTLRDIWAVGSEVHHLAFAERPPAINIALLSALPDIVRDQDYLSVGQMV